MLWLLLPSLRPWGPWKVFRTVLLNNFLDSSFPALLTEKKNPHRGDSCIGKLPTGCRAHMRKGSCDHSSINWLIGGLLHYWLSFLGFLSPPLARRLPALPQVVFIQCWLGSKSLCHQIKILNRRVEQARNCKEGTSGFKLLPLKSQEVQRLQKA